MKNLVNVKNAKVLAVAALAAMTLSACKASYMNTFVQTANRKMLLKDGETGEERLIDYSKTTNDTKQLLSDLPYFKEGDPIKVKPNKRYDGFRVFNAAEAEIEYNRDTIQIRKDKAVIADWKQKSK